MALQQIAEIQLPAHAKAGGFDHAAVHGRRGLLYVAHTANDAVDVIDCGTNTYQKSISGLTGVAGALVSEAHDLVFTSNRGENTAGIFAPEKADALVKVKVGLKPNGLAYDEGRQHLLAANVGDPAIPGSFTVSMVDVSARAMMVDLPVAGRTRWTIFDPDTGCFYVNIADPPQIAIVESAKPSGVSRTFVVPATGPHGLDLDGATHRLFCACDGRTLVVLDSRTGAVLTQAELAGAPDVIFLDRTLKHLYVAIGEPGLIEVFDTDKVRKVETVRTEAGAHTLGFDQGRHAVYAFLPASHRALVYIDRG